MTQYSLDALIEAYRKVARKTKERPVYGGTLTKEQLSDQNLLHEEARATAIKFMRQDDAADFSECVMGCSAGANEGGDFLVALYYIILAAQSCFVGDVETVGIPVLKLALQEMKAIAAAKDR